jgi:hypothetical protein
MAGKTFTKVAMSKPVGKILNSGVGKAMVKVGNTVMRNTPGKMIAGAMKKEAANAKAADMRYRKEAPRGAYGK